jgi:hypothetical protein
MGRNISPYATGIFINKDSLIRLIKPTKLVCYQGPSAALHKEEEGFIYLFLNKKREILEVMKERNYTCL